MTERLQLRVSGLVQGVGFRPYVYRIAQQLRLTGFVKNTSQGVCIEIQGALASSFVPQLMASLPPLAQIQNLQTQSMPCDCTEREFQIMASQRSEEHLLAPGVNALSTAAIIPPDTAPCAGCLDELFDPASRYYHYPFINCTACGPRLSITRTLPYDRLQTSMDAFGLCAACLQDYTDPLNRRYHAEPTACGKCGPQLSTTVAAMVEALQAGQIIALKGMSGYQFICDASNEAAVARLRQRKQRPAKPFAVMMLNVASAALLVKMNEREAQLLQCPARPIVLLAKQHPSFSTSASSAAISAGIAPDLSTLGVMLPTTPMHYLLFHALQGSQAGQAWLTKPAAMALVVTSANTVGNPLVVNDDAASQELTTMAELVVSYPREVVTRADDSVVQSVNQAPQWIRRARGVCPQRILLPYAIPPTLGLGGQLKNTFCITRGDEAFVSQHLGNLTNKATIDFFHETLAHWLALLQVKPQRVACDAHPDFYTTHVAQAYDIPMVAVQHHHAHLAAVAAEHHVMRPALGVALDGYGYGVNGASWGGELFLVDQADCQRLASLEPITQPGGFRAAREPWRMAAAVLHRLGQSVEIKRRFCDKPQVDQLIALLDQLYQSGHQVNAYSLTSSCGRYFDAASALLGVTTMSSFEGQAAMRLQSLVTKTQVLAQGWQIDDHHLSFWPLFSKLMTLQPEAGANLFHGTLIAGLADWVVFWSKRTGVQEVLLSGGCFLNRVLAEGLVQALTAQGLTAYLPQRLPPNDGGLSLGQAWIAGQR